MPKRQLFLEGKFVDGGAWASVRSPYDGREVAQVAQATAAQVEAALQVASAGRGRLQRLSSFERRRVLEAVASGLRARAEEFAQAISAEAGKPITAARVEVARGADTFALAAAAVSSFGATSLPADTLAAQAGTEAEARRFPAGVVVGVVPFNFPLNLGAHKVAPALAVGAPIIVKPPPQAPSAMLLLAQLALEAGADPAALQVLPCDTALAERLATDARVRVLSFTGSARVGWQLKAKAPGKVVLELGGNAAAIVCADAALERAAQRLAVGAFAYAGQVCIKVQRIVVEAAVWAPFVELFLAQVRALEVGDPAREATVVGPVIDDVAAARIGQWVDEAVAGGAVVLLGGRREGRVLAPTVLTEVPRTAKAYREELFGPVVVLERVADFEQALAAVNDSDYGLQAALFTNRLDRVREGFHALEVGAVVVNDAPSFRSDNQPYGGVKGSGLGREGVREAMEDFTEPRVLLYRP